MLGGNVAGLRVALKQGGRYISTLLCAGGVGTQQGSRVRAIRSAGILR